MSSGAYVTAGYRATYNTQNIHPIKVQPETLLLAVSIGGSNVVNSGEPLDDISVPISAVVSRGKRSLGLNARTITVEFTQGVPAGYLPGAITTVAAVNPALLGAPRGATGTYLGLPVRVVGTSPETAR